MIRETSGKSKIWRTLQRLYWRVVWSAAWHIGQRSPRAHGRGPLLVAMGDSLTDPFVGFVFPWQVWVRRVGRIGGYRTVNLGRGGQTTGDMCQGIDEFLSEGQPEIAVLFAGNCDVELGVDPSDTERNVIFIVNWLRAHGVRKIALIGPGMLNLEEVPAWLAHIPDWTAAADRVRAVLRDVAAQNDAVFVDLAQFLRDRIARGEDPDFSRVPYRQSRSWHASATDGHFNAYGNRLVAEALLSATADWRPSRTRRLPLPAIRRRRAHADPGVS
jgi:lysophospholipase L1-like esterase